MEVTEVRLRKGLHLTMQQYGISSSSGEVLTALKWHVFLYFLQEDKNLLSMMTPPQPFPAVVI